MHLLLREKPGALRAAARQWAMQALQDAGILFYAGVVGDADEAITALIQGGLKYDPSIQCAAHEGCGGGGDCAECGSDCGGDCSACGH